MKIFYIKKGVSTLNNLYISHFLNIKNDKLYLRKFKNS